MDKLAKGGANAKQHLDRAEYHCAGVIALYAGTGLAKREGAIMTKDEWCRFTRAWLEALEQFETGDLSMEDGYAVIDANAESVDPEIADFAGALLSEIGGAQTSYAEAKKLLRSDPTVAQVLSFMHS